MVTLANLRGSDLVPRSPSGQGLDLLLTTFKDLAKKKEEQRLKEEKELEIEDNIRLLSDPDVTANQEKEALIRISTLTGAPAAKNILAVIERDDKNEIAEFARMADKAFKIATFLKGIKDPVKRMQAIRQEISKAQIAGEDITGFVELARMTPEEQEIAIERQIITATDVKTLTKPSPGFTLSQGQQRFDSAGRPIASVPATPQETFTPVFDSEGNIVGQRSTLTGKVESDPRTPKIPTRTSLIQNLEAVGIDPKSREGKDIIVKSLTKPGVKIDLSEGLNFKLPPGFMLLDKNDPAKGVTPIPGGPKDNLTSENAAKTQMLQTARKASAGIRNLIFDKDGTLNRTNLFNAQFNTPLTDGRKLRNKMEFGIQAITRLETGAAMPENEVENTRTRFMPNFGDTVEIANTKLQMFDDFINGTLKLIDPSGRFNAERFDTELENRVSQKIGAPVTQQTPDRAQGGFTIKRLR